MANRNEIPSLNVRPEKKARARQRHAAVARDFQTWLKKNPRAKAHRKFSTFDSFCDTAYLEQLMRGEKVDAAG